MPLKIFTTLSHENKTRDNGITDVTMMTVLFSPVVHKTCSGVFGGLLQTEVLPDLSHGGPRGSTKDRCPQGLPAEACGFQFRSVR